MKSILFCLCVFILGCGNTFTAGIQTVHNQSVHTQSPTGNMPVTCLACDPAPTPTPTVNNPYFNATMLNQHWVFLDGVGNTVNIVIEPMQPSNYFPTGSVDMHISKLPGECQTYWAIGTCDAEIHFMLTPQSDGSWISKGWAIHFPTDIPSWATANEWSGDVQQSGATVPYIIVPTVPPDARTFNVVETMYKRWDSPTFTFDSIIQGPEAGSVYWKTTSYLTSLCIPNVYCGTALVSEQFEGPCGHEIWYFGLNKGLVKIVPLDDRNGTVNGCVPKDTSKTIVRIN